MNNKIIAQNDILTLQHEDYSRLREKIISKLSSIKQIIAIYQMGGWSEPGISDLDLILVTRYFDDNKSFFSVSRESLCDTQKEKYILMHPPFVIPSEIFPNIESLFYCSELKLLYGENLLLNKHETKFRNIFELYKFISVLVHTYPRFYFSNTKISLRSFLTFSYSLKHSYKILREYNGYFKDNEVEKYIKTITKLRKDVVENHEFDTIDVSSYVETGRIICKRLFQQLELIIQKQFIINSKGFSKVFYIKNYDTILKFVSTDSCNYKITKNSFYNIVELPVLYLPFILLPLNNTLQITKFQKKNIIGKIKMQVPKELSENLLKIKEINSLYNKLFNKSKVINGMTFELNTNMFWNRTLCFSIKKNCIKRYFHNKYLIFKIKKYLISELYK